MRVTEHRRVTLFAVIPLVMSMCGCMPTMNLNSATLVSSTVPQRLVMRVINNPCGETDEEESEEDLATGTVKGLSKVKDGFGIPYDEHADNYVNPPVPVTDDSYEANKERGIGYAGLEAHLLDTLKGGPATHINDHEGPNEPGTPFPKMLKPKEEQYGCCMRWEYSAYNANGGIDGYYDFLTGKNNSGHMQYVAIHALKTDKWVIACPYDYGPGHNLPTTGGGKYAGGRIGGVTPQVAEDLGFPDSGDCPDAALTEWWWVDNPEQVECGKVEDLSELTGESSSDGNGSSSSSASKPATSARVVTATTKATTGLADEVASSRDERVRIAPANANSFVNRQDPSYGHGNLPPGSVKHIVLQDTNVSSDDADGTLARYRELGVQSMPHFIIDRTGQITQCVPIDRIAHHAGDSTVADANDRFGLIQERDDDTRESPPHAMDAWSVGIALVHEHNEGKYPNSQLNSLDRLVAYIDEAVKSEPKIITKGDWLNGISPDAGDQTEPSTAPDDALVENTSPQEPTMTSQLDSQEAEALRAGSTVTGEFPSSSYQSSRNHAGVVTAGDAEKAAEDGLCDDTEEDEENPDAGGTGIAKKAVELSGSASPQEPISGGWDEVPMGHPTLKAYVDAKNAVYPDVAGWADCGRFAATCVKASGADDSFPAHMNTAYQYEYLTNSDKWKRIGTMRSGDKPDSQCEPGDVLVTEGKGHIMIYTGNEAVKEKYPNSNANFAEASMGAYYGWCYSRKTSNSSRAYAIFRCVKPDNAQSGAGMGDLSGVRGQIVEYCRRNIGAVYDYTPSGGVEGSSYNCSFLSTCAYRAAGLDIPSWQGHQNGDGSQSDMVRAAGHWTTDPSQLKPGDLVFFGSDPYYTGHVGVSLGGDQMIDSIPDGGVQQRTLQGNFVGGGWPFAQEPVDTGSSKKSDKKSDKKSEKKQKESSNSESKSKKLLNVSSASSGVNAYMNAAKKIAEDPNSNYASQNTNRHRTPAYNPDSSEYNCISFVMYSLYESGVYSWEDLGGWDGTSGKPVLSPNGNQETYLPNLLGKLGWETHPLNSDDELKYGDIVFYPAMEKTGHVAFYAGKTDAEGNQTSNGQHTILEAAPVSMPKNGWMGGDVGGHHASPKNGWGFTQYIRPPSDLKGSSSRTDEGTSNGSNEEGGEGVNVNIQRA